SHVVHGTEHGGLYYRRRRGPDWFRVSARCVSRISNRGSSNRILRGRCVSSRRGVRCDVQRSSASKARQLKQLVRGQAFEKESNVAAAEEPSRKQSVDPLSSSVQISRKRRVGIVENQYVAANDAGSSVCELVRGLERLLGEEDERMKSNKQQGSEESIVDPIEENETYDEFDTVRMPVVRSLSKSPQSDEGIETDSDRRRGSVARCWSLDSAAASDEDTSLATQQQRRHKLRVTRCCSSDSAVLSDEDQIKGWDSSTMVEGSEVEHNEGRPRYWRTPSVVISDYSDYSYLDEKLERSDLDLEKYEGTSGTPSQASSCSCLDCDEIRESLDSQSLQVCRSRRYSDSCCICLDSMNATTIRNFNEPGNRRNSCLDSADTYYSKLNTQFTQYTPESSSELQEKTKVDFLDIPPARKISDCSTTSSLSGDESDVTELHQVKSSKTRFEEVCLSASIAEAILREKINCRKRERNEQAISKIYACPLNELLPNALTVPPPPPPPPSPSPDHQPQTHCCLDEHAHNLSYATSRFLCSSSRTNGLFIRRLLQNSSRYLENINESATCLLMDQLLSVCLFLLE
ncbi:hypothetical protein WH47_04126, partial [Habropoda laboriosa]